MISELAFSIVWTLLFVLSFLTWLYFSAPPGKSPENAEKKVRVFARLTLIILVYGVAQGFMPVLNPLLK